MEKLFEVWRKEKIHENQLFIEDGIIDKELWDQADIKILFLLKEAYDSKSSSGSWNLSELIKKRRKATGRTFKPLGQWAYGIFYLKKYNKIGSFPESQKEIDQSILSTSLINIKKSGGTKSSSYGNLKTYVENDWPFIKKQIGLISPDIVICGKTWPLIKSKLNGISNVSDMIFESEGIIYVDASHPANRASSKMKYYSLCSVLNLYGKI